MLRNTKKICAGMLLMNVLYQAEYGHGADAPVAPAAQLLGVELTRERFVEGSRVVLGEPPAAARQNSAAVRDAANAVALFPNDYVAANHLGAEPVNVAQSQAVLATLERKGVPAETVADVARVYELQRRAVYRIRLLFEECQQLAALETHYRTVAAGYTALFGDLMAGNPDALFPAGEPAPDAVDVAEG